jgi:hypothetical protein
MNFNIYRMDLIIKYGLFLVAIVLLIIVPGKLIYRDGVSLCIFNNLTGIQCPLCGMTRASCDMLHFRFGSALIYNPVSLFLPILLIMEIGYDMHPGPVLKKWRRILFILFLISLIALFIFRIAVHLKSL